jgi:N-acetylglucosaminyl-diphospho-decaprenol L-rhamnosyltransferase
VKRIDIIIVSYNSSVHLRDSVKALTQMDEVTVTVVDNASSDDTCDTVRDLDVNLIALEENRGFAFGNNVGTSAGSAPFVLFLNPDARLAPAEALTLASLLSEDDALGAIGPRIVGEDGSLEFSLRRFPRTASTFAQAFFLHRLWPHSSWSDEVIRETDAYEQRQEAEWLSGACLLARRDVVEEIGGWDDGFFLYCEDMDVCKRIRDAGYGIVYDPHVTAHHVGGGSGSRPSLFAVLAESRIRFARKHRGRAGTISERIGIAVGSITHAVLGRGGWPARRGHLASLAVALRPSGTARRHSPDG